MKFADRFPHAAFGSFRAVSLYSNPNCNKYDLEAVDLCYDSDDILGGCGVCEACGDGTRFLLWIATTNVDDTTPVCSEECLKKRSSPKAFARYQAIIAEMASKGDCVK
jgi:hypothetical protein